MIRTVLATAFTLLLAGNAMAQEEVTGEMLRKAEAGTPGYQTYTVELPRKSWTINMKMYSADGEIGEQSIKVIDGFAAQAVSSRTRGIANEDGSFRSCSGYNFLIWFVPESKLDSWLEEDSRAMGTDPFVGGQVVAAVDAGKAQPGYFSTVDDTARHRLLLDSSQEIIVDDLHIFVYAPACERIDFSIDRSDYRHIVNGVFRSDDDVLKVEDIPFELSNTETPSHIADIVFFTDGTDLGWITADGERIPDDFWEKEVEEVEEVEEVK